jgi:hypothetical protein
MKLFKKIGLVLALGASLALVGCGGDNPNESTSASNTPTCTLVSNWNKMSTGLTESKVLSILGNPAQATSDGKVKTYKYEDCRQFRVVKTPGTATTKPVYEYITIGGTVVFSPTNNGYVASFTSPGVPTQAYTELYNYLER